MNELEKMGKVVTTDVLIVGCGLSAMCAALKLKKENKNLDILCLEKQWFGYNGKTTKAGHGALYMAPDDDIDAFCEEQVKENSYGLFLNDQEALRVHVNEARTHYDEMEELGAVFAHNEDGSFHYHREFTTKKSSSANIDLDLIVPLQRNALGMGVRVMERIYFTDFLTDHGTVVGAVGFHMDTMEFYIFRARAVILASNEFNPVVRQMFYGAATGIYAAYEAGAELRNCEQSTNFDLCHRNTANFMYGMHWVIVNSKGENIFRKYHCTNYEEIEMGLVLGMIEEVKQGNYPFYADFSQLPQTSQTEGEGFFQGMLMPLRLDLDKFIFSLSNVEKRLSMPEISMVTYVFNRALKIDLDSKTTVKNLWGLGGMTLAGSAFGGWVHGDGIGYPARTAFHAAKSILKEIDDIELGEVSTEQVEFFKNRIYAPLNWHGKDLPYQVIHYLDRVICMPENSMDRNEETIHNMLQLLKEERENLSRNIYVPEGDGHHLSKAVEARTMIDLLEITYMAIDARKETRGFQVRADYPERDDKNWLKWVIMSKGKDGRPQVSYERIPFEKYKWKPEGWKPETSVVPS